MKSKNDNSNRKTSLIKFEDSILLFFHYEIRVPVHKINIDDVELGDGSLTYL